MRIVGALLQCSLAECESIEDLHDIFLGKAYNFQSLMQFLLLLYIYTLEDVTEAIAHWQWHGL